MILSENCVEITSVGTPSTMPAFCLIMTGYVERELGIWGDGGAIERGMAVARASTLREGRTRLYWVKWLLAEDLI